MIYIIGQCFGVVAIILGVISYQMKTQRQMLFVLTATATVFCIHYLMIGAITGMAMNAVNILRNIAYDYRTRKGSKNMALPIVFAVIQAAMAILTWEAWYSVFIFIGVVANTVCMSFTNAQRLRASILVTSVFVFTYDAFAFSIGGMIFESMSFASAGIGIFRNKASTDKLPKSDN